MLSVTALLVRLVFLFGMLSLIDYYGYQAVKTVTQDSSTEVRRLSRGLYWGVSISLMVATVICMLIFDRGNIKTYKYFQLLFGLYVLFYVPKIFCVVFLFLEDLTRMGVGVYRWAAMFVVHPSHPLNPDPQYLMSRNEFISKMGIAVASVPFTAILHGIWKGRYNYRVKTHTLTFERLPAAFDGLTLAHISDIHAGSFDSKEGVQKGIDLLKAAGADLIFFTGDLVNNVAAEMDDWMEVFSGLQAKYGVYSCLGNHDYGDYVPWQNREEKARNLNRLAQIHAELGWKLLRNQHLLIEKEGEKVAIVGVENWGLPPFPQFGDLDKAIDGLSPDIFKILLSHDPTHWDAKVLSHPNTVDLTLSGHTHGMQFGVEIGDFQWSPVSLRYPRWAGVYTENKQKLNVNRGFGFIGFPGRVGVYPEITLIRLRRALNSEGI